VHLSNEIVASINFKVCLQLISNGPHGVTLIELELHGLIHIIVFHLEWNVVDFNFFLGRWDRHIEGHEGIEGLRDPVAKRALYRGLVLAMEQVSNDRFVSEQMLVPRFQGSLLLGQIVTLIHLHVGLLAFTEEILSHQVEDGVDALMGIVLAKYCKDWSILA
jgi:hypothetical protein